MPKFRKRPVEIEAHRHTGSESRARHLVSWIQQGGYDATFQRIEDHHDFVVTIETLEGSMTASPGDWIIKGVEGEFYPCKPDIFRKTYEVAT